jgi:hypothetical protein
VRGRSENRLFRPVFDHDWSPLVMGVRLGWRQNWRH